MSDIEMANWYEHMKVHDEYSKIYGASHPKTLRIKKGLTQIKTKR